MLRSNCSKFEDSELRKAWRLSAVFGLFCSQRQGLLLSRLLVLTCVSLLTFCLASCELGGSSSPATRLDPSQLEAPQRAFLDALLERTVLLLEADRRDAADEILFAYALFLSGRDAESRVAYDRALKADPARRPHLYAAIGALMTGKNEVAVQEFVNAARADESPFFATLLRVEALTGASRFDEASDELDRLQALFPDEPTIAHTRGHLMSARKQWQPAVDAYEQARTLGGDNPDLDEGIAASWLELGDYARAFEAVERCKREFPDYVEILFQELQILLAQGSADPAEVKVRLDEYRDRTLRWQRVREVEILFHDYQR